MAVSCGSDKWHRVSPQAGSATGIQRCTLPLMCWDWVLVLPSLGLGPGAAFFWPSTLGLGAWSVCRDQNSPCIWKSGIRELVPLPPSCQVFGSVGSPVDQMTVLWAGSGVWAQGWVHLVYTMADRPKLICSTYCCIHTADLSGEAASGHLSMNSWDL